MPQNKIVEAYEDDMRRYGKAKQNVKAKVEAGREKVQENISKGKEAVGRLNPLKKKEKNERAKAKRLVESPKERARDPEEVAGSREGSVEDRGGGADDESEGVREESIYSAHS